MADLSVTPLQRSEQLRVQRIADLRRIVEFLEANPGLDPISPLTVTVRRFGDGYNDLPYGHPGASWGTGSQIVKRARALMFLQRSARRLKGLGKVDKHSNDYSYELKVQVGEHTVRAYVEADLVCHYEETGELEEHEVEEIITPAQVKTRTELRPKRKKVCPPSILHGVLDQVDG